MAALSDGVTNAEKDAKQESIGLLRDTTVAKMAVDLLKEVRESRHGICPSQVNAGDLISRLLVKLRPAECDAPICSLDACVAHPRSCTICCSVLI